MWTDRPTPYARRSFLRSAAAGSLLFPGIVRQVLADAGDPLAARPAPFAAKVKRVIFLFMTGGVSHVDTFDPKPALHRDHGKELKLDHPEIKGRAGYERIFLKRPQWDFAPHGRCGTEVSALFPRVAAHVDDLAVIRSLHTSHSNHYNATLGMHTGSFTQSRPSIGAWSPRTHVSSRNCARATTSRPSSATAVRCSGSTNRSRRWPAPTPRF